jgi:hypothetical protein
MEGVRIGVDIAKSKDVGASSAAKPPKAQ